jgi:HAD superfamily hydrolase (TIGR01509 family)
MDNCPQSPITDIIFDSGGVLFTDGTQIVLDKFQQLLGKSREELLLVFSGNPRWGPPNKPGELYREGKINREQFWGMASEQLKIKDAQLLNKMEQMWLDAYVPIPGMIQLLQELTRRYTLTLWTGNIPERIKYLNERYGLLKYFHKCCFSFSVGANKDNEKFYNALKKEIAPSKPEQAIVVDDKFKYIVNARKEGFKAVLFESSRQLLKQFREFGIEVDGHSNLAMQSEDTA